MIDTKKFHDELINLWNNFYNTDEVYDIIFVEDDYIEVKCENKKVANQFADYIMSYYNAMICYDFRKGNGCYQFSISPSLMIRESKKSIKESNRTKLDIIKDMVDLAYDIRRQTKMDKDSYFGNQPNSVINAKDDKVYEKFVDLAEKLKLHGWNQFIDYAYDLIDEYENTIEESKKSVRKSIKESSFSFVTVSDFCKHCATNNIHCELWSNDGYTKYAEFENTNKIAKTQYWYHEIAMWDILKNGFILYLRDNDIIF